MGRPRPSTYTWSTGQSDLAAALEKRGAGQERRRSATACVTIPSRYARESPTVRSRYRVRLSPRDRCMFLQGDGAGSAKLRAVRLGRQSHFSCLVQ
jgi:hypothetical protein